MTRFVRSLVALSIATLACSQEAPRDASPPAAAAPMTLLNAADESLVRGPVTINYRSLGSGEVILFVHGYGDNLKMWSGVADSLATGYRVIAMDARGFGKSSKPAGVANYGQAMVDDIVALLDHLGAKQAHLVGYSMGGLIAADLALAHPDRVKTVTLAAGGFLEDRAAMRRLIRPWLDDLEHGRRVTSLIRQIVPGLPDSTVRMYSDQIFAESDSAALVGALKSFEDLSIDWTKVRTTSVPAVAIVGANDPLLPYSRDLAAKWPGAKLVEIPETDHVTIPASPSLLTEIRAIVHAHPIKD